MYLNLQKLKMLIYFLHLYFVNSSLVIKKSNEQNRLIYTTQEMVNDVVQKYLFNHKCIVFVRLNNSYEITLNSNNTIVHLSNNNNELISTKEFQNILLGAINNRCSGYIVQTQDHKNFMSLLNEALKRGTIRKNPRMIFIPSSFNYQMKYSKAFLHHSLTSYIPDILLIDVRKIDCKEKYYTYEFSTIKWLEGELQLLDVCKVERCNISNMDLYPNKINNLQGKELRLATMDYPPYVILKPGQQPRGVEIRIFAEFAKTHNATWSIVTDDKQWGFVFINGSSGEGVLGAVADGRADFGCAAIFMWYDPHRLLEYTVPYIRSGVTCLVPRAEILPKWLLPRLPFSLTTWIVLISSLFLLTLIMYAFHKFAHKFVGEKRKSTISDYVFKTIGLLTAQTVSRIHFRPPYRMLLTLFHVYFFWICLYYNTGLSSFLTIPRYEKQINTVEDLLDSGLIWGGTHDVWLFSIGRAETERTKALLKRYQTLSFNELKARSSKRDMAYAIERLPGGYYAIGDFITEDAIDYLTVMDSDIYYEYCGLATYKLSPYRSNLNRLIHKLIDAGIVNHWEMVAANRHLSFKIQMSVTSIKNNQGPTTAITLKLMHLCGAFVILQIGLAIGILIFAGEKLIITFKRNKKLKKKTVIGNTKINPI